VSAIPYATTWVIGQASPRVLALSLKVSDVDGRVSAARMLQQVKTLFAHNSVSGLLTHGRKRGEHDKIKGVKKKTAQAVTATASDSAAGISLEGAE